VKDLSPDHYKMLHEGSGISDEVIELRPYRTVTDPKQLEALGFSRVQARNVPGLLLPVNCTDGTNGLSVYRPDVPRVVKDEHRRRTAAGQIKERTIKYELPPKVGVRVDCPRICRPALADPDKPLWITEGQKKADALASRGVIALALLGVWNFKGRNSFGGVSFLADFDYVAFKNRDVRIVFDSDLMTKAGVRKALERFTEHLQRKGAHVAAVYLPTLEGQKVGVDDFLLTHSIEDLEGLIDGPRPVPRAARPVIELIEDEPLTMSRPLMLLDGRAYAGIWPFVKVTTNEREGSDGEIIKLSTPEVIQERWPLVIRDDGQIFSTDAEEAEQTGFDALPDLVFKLDTIPETKHLWSTWAIKEYREGKRPEPADVFRRVREVVDHYIDFDRSLADQQTMSEMIACYILATWFLDSFQVIGYLWPNGEFGSGKSELLNAVTQMAFMGEMVMAQSTIATIRDAADYGGTLAFDEVERLQQDKTKSDLVAILLAGNRKGATLAAKEPSTKEGKWVTRRFNCFCARLFAATRLPDGALATRSIIVPLIRSVDAKKANRVVTAVESWPHDRRKLIDDLWALTLVHLPDMKRYDDNVATRAQLKGRQLEPWRAILAVAGWLDDFGLENLWDRMHALALAYQKETQELDSTSLTKLVIRALDDLLGTREEEWLFAQGSEVGVFSEVGVSSGFSAVVKTSEVTNACKEIATAEELPIKDETLNPRSIGWILKRLRFRKGDSGHGKIRGWTITRRDISRYKQAFGVSIPEISERNADLDENSPAKYVTSPLPEVGVSVGVSSDTKETPTCDELLRVGVSPLEVGVFPLEVGVSEGVGKTPTETPTLLTEDLIDDTAADGSRSAFLSENPHETPPSDDNNNDEVFYDGIEEGE